MDTTQLLARLVELPSINPGFLPQGHPEGGEHRVADYLESYSQSAGLVIRRQPVFTNRDNILATLKPAGRVRHRVLLAPHMDTVRVHHPSQLKSKIVKGRLYGRGACDTKGCIAVYLTALRNIGQSGRRPVHTEITFAGLVDEEHNQMGSRALAGKLPKTDLAIVGEPTQCRIVTAHKGSLWLKIRTQGKAAHGSRPHKGINAIARMAEVVSLLEQDYARALKKNTHPVLGCGTVNVGRIRGGSQANIVSDHCEIDVDRRVLPGESEVTVKKELKALFRQNGLNAQIDFIRTVPCDPMETDPANHFVRLFLDSARQKMIYGVHYFCDASVFASSGIPSVVFGPGNIDQAHTSDEWIATSQLEKATRILEKFLRSLP